MQTFFAWLAPYFPHFMQRPLFWTVLFLAFAIWQFVRGKWRMDVIALLMIILFSISGILPMSDILAGLSNPNIVLVALLFIISEGIVRTGIAVNLSEWLMRVSGNSEVRVIVLLMLLVAGIGAFMSSTGIVAIFIPVVLSICQTMNISPRRMMMPLSVAGLISGMMTLIATAPNLIVNADLIRTTGNGFQFFDFTPIGVMVLAIGIGYMLLARRWLDSNEAVNTAQTRGSTMHQLIETYRLTGRAHMVVVEWGSALAGKTIEELDLRVNYGVNIVAIQRVRRFNRLNIVPFATNALREKDVLLLDLTGSGEQFEAFCQQFKLTVLPLKGEYFSAHAKSIGMAEVALVPEADCIGKRIADLHFRRRFGLSVVGIKRDQTVLEGNIIHTPLKFGDVLLVMGVWEQIVDLQARAKNFFLLNAPTEMKNAVPAASQAPYAILSLVVMVALMISGIVPNVIAALIACLMMAHFGCVDMKSAYGSIHWPLIVLIVGMMPFSLALQKTGGVALVAEQLLSVTQGLGGRGILAVVYALTLLAGAVMSTSTTAILMMPIAISVAQQLGFNPLPFGMAVAIASSAAFLTPLSPVNVMVLAPSGYRFVDFLKVGTPLTLIVMLACVYVIPLLFPLQ